MRRRALLLASAAWSGLAAMRALAQAAKPPQRIALLMPATREFSKPQLEAFTARLAELGHVEGRDIVIEKRWADGSVERLPALARELLALKPQVIVAPSAPVAAAFKKQTDSIPVVFTAVTGPDSQGFVASYAHPGGNMTGVSFQGGVLGRKLVEMVRETLPAARRIAIVDLDYFRQTQLGSSFLAKLAEFGLSTEILLVKGPADFAPAFKRIARWKADIVYCGAAPLFTSYARQLNELAAQARLPLIAPRRALTVAGGLLSYDNDLREDYRRAAGYVHRILKGARPADLPVDQPERFHLAVNLRTARALGITIPQSVLLRADEVIE